MHQAKSPWIILLAALTAVIAVGPALTLHAQGNPIVLTVILPDIIQRLFGDDFFDAFEAANPGVSVEPVYVGFDALYAVPPYLDLEDHLDDIADYVSRADVVPVGSDNLSVEATRAGYFLDLSPLANTDPSLDAEDFFSAAWRSFQWDGGVWALPSSVNVTLLIYDPVAFDQAGVAYPNANWTLDDLASAARALARRDSAGNVTVPGLGLLGDTTLMLRALAGQGFYDQSTTPESPLLDTPALERLLTAWVDLEAEGVVTQTFNGDINEVPMRLMNSYGLMGIPTPEGEQYPVAGALLPGGVAGLEVYGFAVSSGTLYPEQAYALAKYLSRSVEAANALFGAFPARRSLIGVQPPAGESGIVIAPLRFSPEQQAVIDQALAGALPLAEMRYSGYVSNALGQMHSSGVDAHTALQDAEAQAATNLQMAASLKATTAVVVATPVPTPVLQPGEMTLNFSVLSFITPLPNQEQWDQVIRDFVASDPQVGQIVLNDRIPLGGISADAYAENNDCFYLPYNAVPGLDLTAVLNIDPFLDADPAFDRNDVVGNTLALLRRDNRTWAYPLVIQPQALSINRDLFAQAGLPTPENGWTVDAFVDALRTLKAGLDDDTSPFVPADPGGSYLRMLMAAYGGIPLDLRADPPTLNFTDPVVVEAIRQVLDLARAGLIAYSRLASNMFAISMGGGNIPILAQSTGMGFMMVVVGSDGDEIANPYVLAPYPQGTQFAAASYDVGTAYISANTPNPDACYRWISTLAQHPELFSGMPARRSQINDPALVASEGPEAAAFYRYYDALISDPDTVVFPSVSGSGDLSPRNYLLQFWLNRAFDRYVLEDADLLTELEAAQTYTQAFLGCIAGIPSFDPAAGEEQSYDRQYTDCAVTVDPTMSALFSGS